jgi:hypothetical protein
MASKSSALKNKEDYMSEEDTDNNADYSDSEDEGADGYRKGSS